MDQSTDESIKQTTSQSATTENRQLYIYRKSACRTVLVGTLRLASRRYLQMNKWRIGDGRRTYGNCPQASLTSAVLSQDKVFPPPTSVRTRARARGLHVAADHWVRVRGPALPTRTCTCARRCGRQPAVRRLVRDGCAQTSVLPEPGLCEPGH